VLTLFPGIFEGFLQESILARAIERGLVTIRLVDVRDYAADRHRICDDYPYGGGPGMVMKPEPLAAALEAVGAGAQGRGRRVVFLTPSGRLYRQETAAGLAGEAEIVLVCGRYEGVDQRVIDAFATDELSVGDYVLSGGEVAAMAVIDTVARLLPGVITGESLAEESFVGGLLEYPQSTRPEEFRGMRVPEVLLSGHHERIRRWRLERSVEKTMRLRPELLASGELPEEAREAARMLARQAAPGRPKGEGNGPDEGDRG
jgi:tRNA (guanine37-N1)-methyltransferase